MNANRWIVAALACSACGEPATPPQPPTETGAPLSASAAPSGARATAAPSGAGATVASSTSGAAPPAKEKPEADNRFGTLGDTTCAHDDDCAVTTKHDCCACCPGPPVAVSSSWLRQRESSVCAHTRCEPCGDVDCKSLDAKDFQAACIDGTCRVRRQL